MKKLSVVFFLLIFILFSCNTNKNEKTDPDSREEKEAVSTPKKEEKITETINYRVSDKSAGDFKIGGRIPSSSEVFNIRSVIYTETVEGEVYEKRNYIVSREKKDLLHILPGYDEMGNNTDKIDEIIVLSSEFKTDKGIGIGSTLEEFIKAYPEYKLWYTYVSGMYVLETEDLAVQFILSADDFTGKTAITSDMIMLNPADFKPNAKIVKLRII